MILFLKYYPRLMKWMDKYNEKCHFNATAGEHYVFEFLLSGIAECQTVRCLCCRE